MTKLDRVGNSDYFSFRGFPLLLQVLDKGSQVGNAKKRWNVCTVMVLLYIHNKNSGVRLTVCPVI